MARNEYDGMTREALAERFRSLMGAYDQACMAYDHAKAAEIHREFYAVENELWRRDGNDDWRCTGLDLLSVEEVIERFKERAIAYDEADGSDQTEHLYWDLEDAKNELQRRAGDQRRALFALYTHPDIRVRAAAANATRTLAPLLSRYRQLNIDDDDWAPPAEGLDIAQAGLETVFPIRAKRPDRLQLLNVEQLIERFVELALAQCRAELHGEIAKQNRLITQGWAVADELKSRPGDQRSALISLYTHPHVQVRLNAAQLTLAVAPTEARGVIQAIADSNERPQAMDAGMCLWALDQGIAKPT